LFERRLIGADAKDDVAGGPVGQVAEKVVQEVGFEIEGGGLLPLVQDQDKRTF
jgi:hypothetical protein